MPPKKDKKETTGGQWMDETKTKNQIPVWNSSVSIITLNFTNKTLPLKHRL